MLASTRLSAALLLLALLAASAFGQKAEPPDKKKPGPMPDEAAGPAEKLPAKLEVRREALPVAFFSAMPNAAGAPALPWVAVGLSGVPWRVTLVFSEEPPEEPRHLGYLAALKSDNPVVRKRAVLVLKKLLENKEVQADDVVPALNEVVFADKEESIQELAIDAINNKSSTTAGNIKALVKGLKDSSQGPGRRRSACKALSALYFADKASAGDKTDAYGALEETVADKDSEVQAAAALALETIDRKGFAPARLFRVRLDAGLLRVLNLKAEDVLKTLQKQYPKLKAKLLAGNLIEYTLSADDDGDASLRFEKLVAGERQGQPVYLKDVGKVEEATAPAGKESK